MTFMVRHPFSFVKKLSQTLAWFIMILFAFKEYSFHEKLTKNMGPHCTVRLRMPSSGLPMALTLNPLKVYVQYLQCGWSSCMMVSLSHLQRLCHWIFRRILKYNSPLTGSLWHFGRKMSGKVFAFSLVHSVKGFPPRTLLMFRTVS